MKKYRYKLWQYLLIVFLLTWIPWGILAFIKQNANSPIGVCLIALGGIAPTLSLISVLLGYHKKTFRRDFVSRLSFKKAMGQGSTLLVFLPFLYSSMAVLISVIFFNGSLSQFSLTVYGFGILTFVLFTFFFGPLPEELGWRGYLLDALWERMSLIKASFIIGIIWGLWHIPLFFIQGYPLQERSTSLLFLFIYFIDLIPKSIIISYIYTKGNRSVIAAILFHFVSNLAGTIIEIDIKTELIQLLLVIGIAASLSFNSKEIFQNKFGDKTAKV